MNTSSESSLRTALAHSAASRPVRMDGVLAVAALCGAPTSCEHFSDVEIPATDTSPPIVVNGLETPVESYTANDAFEQELTDPTQAVIAVASGFDTGGVRRISVGWSVARTCTNGSVSVHITPVVAPQTETQSGGVGDSVSNGIWLARSFRPSQYGCPSGMWPTYVGLSWDTEAEDFAGRITRHGGHVFWQRR